MTPLTFADHLAGKVPHSTHDDATLPGVLHDVRVFIHRYVRLSNEQTTLAAVWTAMTHAIDAFDFAAYLHITSPVPECGKSRLLDVLEALVLKAWRTEHGSAAVLMRKVDKEHPTVLLDEIDAAFKGADEYSEALRGLLNAGFHRSGKHSCCVGQGANLQPHDFSVFGPKAIAGIGRLPATVESRSIPVVMKRKGKDEIVHKFRLRHAHEAATPIREQLAVVMRRHVDALRDARPEMPSGLSDRTEDVLEPLFAIADQAGGDWPKEVRAAAVSLMGQAVRTTREADQNFALELLTDVRQILESKDFPFHTKDEDPKFAFATKALLPALHGLEDAPWATYGKNDKPLTGHGLARLLKQFEIRPAGLRDGDDTFKGYERRWFEDAFARYLDSIGHTVTKADNPNKNGPEFGVTDAKHPLGVTDLKTAVDPINTGLVTVLPIEGGVDEAPGGSTLYPSRRGSLTERRQAEGDEQFRKGWR